MAYDHTLFRAAVDRRRFLAGSAALGAGVLTMGIPRLARADSPPLLVTSIRSLSNPYHAVWKVGADAFAKQMGLEHVTLVTEGNSEKGISDINAMIAKTNGHMVLNVDPNNTPDARPIVEACAKAGVFVVTWWNKPADLHPWDFNPHYISHIEFDGTSSGAYIAEELFKAMGGTGGFVAIGGIISDSASIDRRRGMLAALKKNPKITLLDWQTGEWQSQKAFDITSSWLTRFGPKIKGIWAANDDMGTGALEALRSQGLAGQIPVVGIDGIKAAVEAVKAGEFACTVSSDPYWQGGIGLSMGLEAAQGKFDPSKEPKLHREFNASTVKITSANVDAYIKTQVDTHPQIDWTNLWDRVASPITYS
ncbi:sugar ABC transporter substrate-binding protein [Acidisoma silvae]|uniref:Sugar ABC transporter substrate-binding protein n=1 Tax=Acidisoma silvae TaxID=2802396 RepID=A0A963YVT3_9PROT|nr:sugar ABC transporter substrate-binding protein [Acidisoma silvae]MCB8877765.1 sugar ABC transporter substrate-binding protein [Acidisoma silvae]